MQKTEIIVTLCFLMHEKFRDFFISKSIYKSSSICKEIFLLFSVFFLPGYISQSSGIDPDMFDSLQYHLSVIIITVPQIFLLLYILSIRKDFPGSYSSLSKMRFTDALIALPIFFGLFLLTISISYAYSFFSPNAAEEAGMLRWQFSNYPIIPLLFISVTANAAREEIFFRFYLLGRLSQIGLALLPAVSFSSLLFAIGHIYQGLNGFLVAFVSALFLGIVFMKTKRIYALILAHGLYNFIALLFSA